MLRDSRSVTAWGLADIADIAHKHNCTMAIFMVWFGMVWYGHIILIICSKSPPLVTVMFALVMMVSMIKHKHNKDCVIFDSFNEYCHTQKVI